MSVARYQNDQSKIRKLVIIASALITIGISLIFILTGAASIYLNAETIRANTHEHLVDINKQLMKNRVDNFVGHIQAIRIVATKDWKAQLSDRTQNAIKIAESIWINNRATHSDTQMKLMILEGLMGLRRENGEPLVMIIDITTQKLLTANPKITIDLSNIKDFSGEVVIKKKIEALKNSKGEFFTFKAPKINADKKGIFEQLSYAETFAPFNWIFESVEYTEDLEEKLKEAVLEQLALVGLTGNYLFIDNFKGYSLLMDGQLLNPPVYSWNLQDANGMLIMQEELNIALDAPDGDGGFIEYVWYNQDEDKNEPYISYMRAFKDWEWKIGSGSYMEEIEAQVAKENARFLQETIFQICALLAVAFAIWLIALLAIYWINRATNRLFTNMDSKIDEAENQLMTLNSELQNRVNTETEKRITNEEIMMQNSKLADMGSMMSLIVHQWKQPLNALAITIDSFADTEGDEVMTKTLIEECQSHINYMVDTVTDFRNFLKPEISPTSFSLIELLISSGKLINHRLKNSMSRLVLPNYDVTIYTMRNDLKQVLINLFGNACDANEGRVKKGEIKYGEINCSVTEDEGFVTIDIADNGGGIPSTIIGTIFEPYVTTKGEKGTGLGLYMSHRIVKERIKGELTVHNSNGGTTFTIKIPARKQVI